MKSEVEILRSTFEAALPSGTVLAEVEQIDQKYRRNVTALDRKIPLVLRPGTEADVERIVALANQHRTPLYPISTGKNWGLGSKLPVLDGGVVVDLSGLNEIACVNESAPYAIIGPGVTQGQLAAYLAERHPELTLNLTGSFAHTSIVGNVLDRGDGAYARIDDLLGVRGILGNGTPFQAGGVWNNPGVDLPAHGCRYNAGPDLTGLFSQSNFGIVTQMAFRLSRKPEQRYIFWGVARDAELERVVDTFRHFGDQKSINPGGVNIGYANRFVQARSTLTSADQNDLRRGESLARLPSVPLGDSGKNSAAASDSAEWNFYALVEGTRAVADIIVSELREAFPPFCVQVGAYRTDSEEDPRAVLPPFLHPLVKPLTGIPDDQTIRLIYQLTGTALPEDPAQMDADHTPFGMKCYIPVLPTTGQAARRASSIVAALREQHSVNIKLSLFGDGRTLVTIHFRTDDPDQVSRAVQCEAALWNLMTEAGFPPYRVSIDQMQRLTDGRPEFFSLVQQLKVTLDPNGIIAPGRYCPAPRVPTHVRRLTDER